MELSRHLATKPARAAYWMPALAAVTQTTEKAKKRAQCETFILMFVTSSPQYSLATEAKMVPVDLVLSEMAEEVGFKVEQVIAARYKGNSSQHMGKYGRVPVRESVVIWQKEG
ncbi:MAG: hypothetical protein KME26_09015 [Oscillatoria princeps RMCB-10]|nr:hypothetical protein [Oscillatoria princeps RMCB-10]